MLEKIVFLENDFFFFFEGTKQAIGTRLFILFLFRNSLFLHVYYLEQHNIQGKLDNDCSGVRFFFSLLRWYQKAIHNVTNSFYSSQGRQCRITKK